MKALDRIILSWPKNLTDKTEVKPAGKNSSWIQLARTGNFVSTRYGKFSITKDDLSTMCSNFGTITPKAPTELPIDYDHLSMDPKKPGDGIAAGWMKELELREDGEELWARVQWTDDGADRIAKQEYRFISPSFVKDHTHKDGKKIGTTLLAAAITNHPFLEGMKALTLFNFSAMGDLALAEVKTSSAAIALSLMDVGQRVSIKGESGTAYVIAEVVGAGDDAFVALEGSDGERVPGWRRATELEPARLTTDPQMEEATSMMTNPGDQLLQLMNDYKRAHHCDDRTALLAVSRARPDLAQAHREDIRAPGTVEDRETADLNQRGAKAINLHRQPDEGFAELVGRVQREQRMDLRAAIRIVSEAHPDLAAAYERG